MVWPDAGLQTDQQGSGRELRNLGRQGSAWGHSLVEAPSPAPRGCSQALVPPSCFSDLPCLPPPRPPAFWMAVAQGVASVVLPSLASHPSGRHRPHWSAEKHVIERFWTRSKGLEQLSGAESNLGSKEELSERDLFWSEGRNCSPQKTRLIAPRNSQE